MHLNELFGALSAFLVLAGFAPYLYSIYRGKTRPHLYSWIIWSLTQGTGTLVMVSEGASWGAAGVTAGTLLCIAVAISSLWRGSKNIRPVDGVFLAGALSAFSFYVFISEPYLALSLVIIIDVLGFEPTLRKTIADPRSEPIATWAMFGLSNIFALAALPHTSFLTAGYPIALLACETALTALLAWRRYMPRPR